jgi:hypothetical protein
MDFHTFTGEEVLNLDMAKQFPGKLINDAILAVDIQGRCRDWRRSGRDLTRNLPEENEEIKHEKIPWI